jgi:hypothetical protein
VSNLASRRPDRVHELIDVLTGWAAEHAPGGASALTVPGSPEGLYAGSSRRWAISSRADGHGDGASWRARPPTPIGP